MATVGHTVTGLNANTKALRVGDLRVLADGLTAEQIIARLADANLLRQAGGNGLEDSIPVDDGL